MTIKVTEYLLSTRKENNRMLTLIFILLIIATVISCKSYDFEELGVAAGIGAFIVGVALIIVAGCLVDVTYRTDEMIQIYSEENAEVEKKLENAVQSYMQYEKDIMISVSPDTDTISLISLYPDLKSDRLVESEIETYISNNDKIKELKANKTMKSTYKFLLFFGH